MWFEFDGKGSYGDEEEDVWGREKWALVEGEKKEFESGEPNKEEGGGATEVEGSEGQREGEEEVEDREKREEPQGAFW